MARLQTPTPSTTSNSNSNSSAGERALAGPDQERVNICTATFQTCWGHPFMAQAGPKVVAAVAGQRDQSVK